MLRPASLWLLSCLLVSAECEQDFTISFKAAHLSGPKQELSLDGPILLDWHGWKISAQRSGLLETDSIIVKGEERNYQLEQKWSHLLLMGRCHLTGKTASGEPIEINALAFVLDWENQKIVAHGQVKLNQESVATSLALDLKNGFLHEKK